MEVRSEITPCIFGTTNGFEIHTLTRVPLNVEDLAFGITRSEVELSDHNGCVKILRLSVKAEVFTWIGVYRKAFEIGFSREGGYYGAGVWLAGITVDARLVLDVLNNLADQVKALAIEGARFQRQLSDIIDNIQIPPNLMPLKDSSERYREGGVIPDAMQGAYVCQRGSHWEIIDFAQNNVLAGKFRSMIVAPEDSFPRAASSRLERYADLTEIARELASDLAEKIAELQKTNVTLERKAATIERELSEARNDAERFNREAQAWSDRLTAEVDRLQGKCRKLEGQLERSRNSSNEYRSDWHDRIFLAVIVLALISVPTNALLYFFPQIGVSTEETTKNMAEVPSTKDTNAGEAQSEDLETKGDLDQSSYGELHNQNFEQPKVETLKTTPSMPADNDPSLRQPGGNDHW